MKTIKLTVLWICGIISLINILSLINFLYAMYMYPNFVAFAPNLIKLGLLNHACWIILPAIAYIIVHCIIKYIQEQNEEKPSN